MLPEKREDAETLEEGLSKMILAFSLIQFWVSDQGRHSDTDMTHTLEMAYKFKNQFTVAYLPWVNGTVESLHRTHAVSHFMRHVQAGYRCIQAELHLGPQY